MKNIRSDISLGKLYEGVDLSGISPKEIAAGKKLYDYLLESANIAEEEGKELGDVLDEGILTGLLGGITGATLGPALGRAICKVLGINESGMLGNLLTSRIFLVGLGGHIGFSM